MSYKSLIKKVAKEHNTTSKEVDYEIREAIKAAGLDMSPEEFIAMGVARVKEEMSKSNIKSGKD